MLAAETLAAHESLNADERASLLRSIIREARRLASLIDNTLLFARSGAVGFAPRPTLLLARTILEGVAEAMSLAVADAEQRLEIGADESLTAKADPQLLHQALVNLVDNAIKFGPRGQRIGLGAEASERGVRFIVDDEGPGIPAADRQRVFIPYERLDRDRETERAGAGVGLSVVRRVSDVTGGRVWIEQRADGPGARVILEVPGG
jgi:signal transduction histidine kinase